VGHRARKRLIDNRAAVAKHRQSSIPSKPTPVPKSRLQALLPETGAKKVLTATTKAKQNLRAFLKPTKEFKRIAGINRILRKHSKQRTSLKIN